MACALITGPSYPSLEKRLLLDLQQAGRDRPLAPQWVVAPSSTLVNHLRLRLAESADPSVCAGVRVVNLPRLAERLTAALLDRPCPAWHPLLDLTLYEMVGELPKNSPLASLREIHGGATLLRRAFTDLAEGGFGADPEADLEELAGQPELGDRERAVLRLFARWTERLQSRKIDWAPLVLQHLPDRIGESTDAALAAALGAEPGQIPALFVYGFYEWLDVHLQWLAALARRVPATIYYPYAGDQKNQTHPAFSFAEPVLADLRGRLDVVATERSSEEDFLSEEKPTPGPSGGGEPVSTSPPGRGERVGSVPPDPAAFFLQTFPDGKIPDQPPEFLSYQKASGIRAEAISAALRVRRWLDDKRLGLRPRDILVVAMAANHYVEAIEETFRAFCIPLRIGDVPAGPAPTDEPLRMLARIWEDQAPAEWVLALLRAAPDLPVAAGVEVDRFERKVRKLGIWGGWAWRAALARPEFQGAEGEDDGRHPISFTSAEKKLVESIQCFVADPQVARPETLSVAEALEFLRHLAAGWLPSPAPLAPLLEAVEQVRRHSPRLQIELRQWTRWLADAAVIRMRPAPLTQAVSFLPLMRARGLTARAIVVLGLSAGEMPQRVEDDPLLSESAAQRIAAVAAQIGHRLPLKARVTEEMLLLFHLIHSAADRIHWVVPETDAAGKAVAPAPWVQRYLQPWRDRMGQPASRDRFARRIARSPFLQAAQLADLDHQGGRYLPPSLALTLSTNRSVESDVHSFLSGSVAKRGRDLLWSGGIGGPPAIRRNRIGVTRLESLARCPFRFYAGAVAGWDPLEPLTLSHTLDPMARGTLLHRLLETAVQPWLGKRKLRDVAALLLAHDARPLKTAADQLAETDAEAGFAVAMLPPVFREAALREVVRMAVAYFEWADHSDAVAVATEQEFSRKFPGLGDLTIAGKIDRIDATADGRELTDFKSGKLPADYRKSVRLGWQIQAALYPWLCGEPAAVFRYLFLGRFEAEIGQADGAPSAESLLGDLAPILQQGAFVPTSNQVLEALALEDFSPCQYCPSVSACRRFEPDAARSHAELFLQIAPQRVESLRAAAAARKRTGAR